MSNTQYQKCYDLTNSVDNNVHYKNNKLYYNSGLHVNDEQNNCIDNNLSDSQQRAVSCNDSSAKYIYNTPTYVISRENSSGNFKKLSGPTKCLTVTGNTVSNIDRTNISDPDALWEYKNNILNMNGKCLSGDSNGSLSLENCNNLDIKQKWITEGNEIRNLQQNKCLDIDNKKLSECHGKYKPIRWDYINGNLKNQAENKCLDGDGTNIYLSNCDYNNGYQKWDLLMNGNKIKHRNSGKCLKNKLETVPKTQYSNAYGINKLYFDECDCSDKLKDTNFSNGYNAYISTKVGDCMNTTNWGYDGDNGCLPFIYDNPILFDKFINWCDLNSKNNSINKYCLQALEQKDNIQYFSRVCNTGNNMLTKPICTSIAIDNNLLNIDEKFKNYIKIKYDDALEKHCRDNFYVKEGEVAKLNRKYSIDPLDNECLKNWTYVRADGTKEIIKTLTNFEDTNFWCMKASSDKDPLFKCYLAVESARLYSTNGYIKANTLWKSLGAERELPLRVYKYFIAEFDNDINKIIININNTYKTITKSTHPADILLFYTGYPYFIGDEAINKYFYSDNGKYKIEYTTNWKLYDIENKKSIDINLSDISIFGYVFMCVTNTGNVLAVDSSGTKKSMTTTGSFVSTFDNKQIVNTTQLTEDYTKDNTKYFILIIILVFSILLGVTFVYKKFNKKNVNKVD